MRRFLLVASLVFAHTSFAKSFTIFHTNDEHSRFLGFAPDFEYNPNTTGDGTIGGVARLATMLKQKRKAAEAKGATLTVGAGDFSMGTLFHTITREKAGELQLLSMLGYDAITLGNHEFDFGVKGLSLMIESALREIELHKLGSLPPILASNLVLTQDDPRDAKLRQFVKDGVIKTHTVIVKDGIRFGLFGLMGYEANEVAANKAPASFADPIETAKKMVKILREDEKADVVILLSHGGVARPDENWIGTELLTVGDDGHWIGEDINMAAKVKGIDVIISGHSHTPLLQPIVIGKTQIVQTGSDIRYLGELAMHYEPKNLRSLEYKLNKIDDQILGDSEITKKIDEFKKYINETKLKVLDVNFEQATAKVDRNLTRVYTDNTIGYLLSSAFQSGAQADIGFCPDGIIRDDISKGKSGIQSVSDIFRLSPLGIGETDEEVGYPLIKIHVNAKELKQVLEVLLLAYKFKGSTYHPRFAGIEFDYNPYRVPLDRVSEARIKKADGTMEVVNFRDENVLYSIGTTSYVGKFFWIIPEISMGLFKITPKFANGSPILDFKDAVVHRASGDLAGTHEYKSWLAVFDFIKTMPKDPELGIPLLATEGEHLRAPMIENASLSPALLFKNATWIQWTACLVAVLVLALLGLLGNLLRRKFCSR